MALTTESYNADGSTKIFTVASTILSASHVRVDFNYKDTPEDDYSDHNITSDKWDVINNSIVFVEAPANGYVVKITTSTTGEDLDTPPDVLSSISVYIQQLIEVQENLSDIIKVSEDLGAIDTIETNLEDVNTTATNIVDIKSVADNVDKLNAIITAINALNDNKAYNIYFHGKRDSNPTTRVDGSPLRAGDQYFSTVEQKLMVYDGSFWGGASGIAEVQFFYGLRLSEDGTYLELVKIPYSDLEEINADDFLYWTLEVGLGFFINDKGHLIISNNN